VVLLRLAGAVCGCVPRGVRCSTWATTTPALRSPLDPCHTPPPAAPRDEPHSERNSRPRARPRGSARRRHGIRDERRTEPAHGASRIRQPL